MNGRPNVCVAQQNKFKKKLVMDLFQTENQLTAINSKNILKWKQTIKN